MYKPNTTHSGGGGVGGSGEGLGTPFNGLYGKVPPERRQVYQTVGNTRDGRIWRDRENLSSKYLKGPGYIILIQRYTKITRRLPI